MSARRRKRDAGLVAFGDILETVLRDLGGGKAPDFATLSSQWADLAGEPWGSRTRPVHLRNTELVVEVSDGATASLLRYQAPELCQKLGEELGVGVVQTIVLRVVRNPGSR